MNATDLLNDFLLALCVWREARGELPEGKALVAAVIINRSKDPAKRWPRTVAGVVLQPKQFSSFNAGDPNCTLYPKESDASWVESVEAATKAITANPALTKANHYHTTAVNPPWADATKVTQVAGNHVFYNL